MVHIRKLANTHAYIFVMSCKLYEYSGIDGYTIMA